jgi:hypothetical protein
MSKNPSLFPDFFVCVTEFRRVSLHLRVPPLHFRKCSAAPVTTRRSPETDVLRDRSAQIADYPSLVLMAGNIHELGSVRRATLCP